VVYSCSLCIVVPTADLAPSLKPSKEQVNLALSVAKTSTASVGKFTKALPRENEVKKPKGKKRKVILLTLPPYNNNYNKCHLWCHLCHSALSMTKTYS